VADSFDDPAFAIAGDVCCDLPVIRATDPGGAPVVLDAKPVDSGPAALVVTVDGRVIGFPKANPKYVGRRYQLHECPAKPSDRRG
jgi:hypothetical protein